MDYGKLMLASLLAQVIGSSLCLAHSGNTFIADPIADELTIDGDLSDWPSTSEYELSVPYLFNGKPNTADYRGRFRVGCDVKRETLYVAVEVVDDIINVDSPDDLWNSRDACEVFLTLDHSSKPSVPIQFVYRKSARVAQADKVNESLQKSFQVARKINDNRLTYEWKIDLASLPGGKGGTKQTTIFGFDVGYIDVDKGNDIAVFSSSPGRAKHLSSQTLGDLFVNTKQNSLVTVVGTVELASTPESVPSDSDKPTYPAVSITSDNDANFYVQVPCGESGQFKATLPPGKYIASLVDTLAVRVSEEPRVSFTVDSDKATPVRIPNLEMKPIEKSDLIEETGILTREEFDADQVDRFVEAYMDYHKIPGLSLALVKDGEIVYGKGFGVRSLAKLEPVNDSTVFEVASMTKPMFAFAVCRLAERGVIDLDTPLWKYLPYSDAQHDDRYKKITARMVLCHRTGFPNWRDGQLEIHFEPGTQQQYSGEAYGYLAKVVSHLADKDIASLMNDEVFTPLGIENTFLTWDEAANDSLVAMPHDENNTTLVKSQWSDVWVAGCLHVDAKNFAKFLRAIIHEEGLSRDSYAEMLRPQVRNQTASEDQNFSLGFVVGDSSLGKHYGHGGHNTGFTSRFEAFKDHRSGYVFMVNNYQAPQFERDLKSFLITGSSAKNRLDDTSTSTPPVKQD